jgi:hypothetical protein
MRAAETGVKSQEDMEERMYFNYSGVDPNIPMSSHNGIKGRRTIDLFCKSQATQKPEK